MAGHGVRSDPIRRLRMLAHARDTWPAVVVTSRFQSLSLVMCEAMSTNATVDSSASASDCAPETKRRKVSHATYMTWKRDLDRECSTMSWLDCETHVGGRKKVVTKLLCSVCKKFKERI